MERFTRRVEAHLLVLYDCHTDCQEEYHQVEYQEVCVPPVLRLNCNLSIGFSKFKSSAIVLYHIFFISNIDSNHLNICAATIFQSCSCAAALASNSCEA